jgi:hypothetical protein
MSARKAKKDEPMVGIVFLVNGRVYLESTPLHQAEDYGRFKVHPNGHDAYWETLRIDGEYQDVRRARIAYDTRSQEFTLLADPCILRQPIVVAEIMRRLQLPAAKKAGDDHYRCVVCLKREK